MTQPLVPSDVDLRDFGFMPLDVRRLLTSETWIEAADVPKVGHAVMCLWAESWHQLPAASLPDNDKVLARLAMCDPKTWKRLKTQILASWVKCDDGLLYHPVVAEKALESWKAKLAQRDRTRAATEAREAKRRAQQESRDVERDDSRDEERDVERDVHQGTVKGQGELKAKAVSSHAEKSQPAPTEAGRACRLMREAGCVHTNPSHTDLVAAIAEGVTPEVLADTAREAVDLGKPKPFAWAIATARGRHAQGARPITGEPHGTREPRESLVDRNARRAAEILQRTGTE